MKKRVIVLSSALALGAVAAIQAQQVFTIDSQAGARVVSLEGRLVKGMPYSAEIVTENIQTLADGNRIVQRTTGRVYRDSEGRVRREEDRSAGAPSVSISDPVAGTSFTLDPANRIARETPQFPIFVTLAGELQQLQVVVQELQQDLQQRTPAGGSGRGARGRGRGGPGNDQAEEKLQDRQIEGVLASGVRRTTTIAAGTIGNERPITIVSEEWTSPDLQVLVLTDFIDPRTGHSTYRLLKITRVDPDPALFQVPADYTVQRMPALGPAGVRGNGAGGRGGARGQ